MIERNAALKEASINLHGTESETLHVSPEFFAEAEKSAIFTRAYIRYPYIFADSLRKNTGASSVESFALYR